MTTTDPQTDTQAETLPRIETPQAAEALCARVLETTAELIGLLDQETELLRGGRAQEIAPLNARKSALSTGLARDMSAFGRDADYIRMAAPERLDAMKAQQESFRKSLQANQNALEAIKSVSESLLRTIAAKASERRAGPGTYGKTATMTDAAPAKPGAISVDRSL